MKPFLLFALCALSVPLSCGRAHSPQGPNVVLISIDSIRADHLGPYGRRPSYAPDIAYTPAMDALALEGVTFDQAWSTSSWTLPAHMALMTGLTDLSHGVIDDSFRRDPLHQTLARVFADAGYATGGFFSGPYLDPKYGFSEGFQEYESGMMSSSEIAKSIQHWVEKRKIQGGQEPSFSEIKAIRDRASHWDITSPRINRLAKSFIKRNSDQPFFLFAHYFDAHYDHIPDAAEPGLGKVFDPQYAGSMTAENWYFSPLVRQTSPPFRRRISERDLGHVEALYDAEIHWVDRHLGELFETLKQQGLWDNTIVALVTDHGDEFFDHGSIGHRSTLYQELLKTALIIRVPQMWGAGGRADATVSIYDVAPTLLDLAGIAELPHAEGRSLSRVLRGESLPARGSFGFIFTGTATGTSIQESFRFGNTTVIRSFEIDLKRSNQAGIALKQRLSPKNGLSAEIYLRDSDPLELRPIDKSHPQFELAMANFGKAFAASALTRQKIPRSPLSQRYAPQLTDEELATLAELGYASRAGDDTERVKTPPLRPLPAPHE